MAIPPWSLLQSDFARLAHAGAVAEVLELEEPAHLDLALAAYERALSLARQEPERRFIAGRISALAAGLQK